MDDETIGILKSEGKIAAIKRVIDRDGLNLVMAKDYVEKLEAELPPESRPAAPNKAQKSGAGFVAVLLLLAFGVPFVWYSNSERSSTPAASTSSPRLEVKSHELVRRDGRRFILGEAVNASSDRIGEAFIEFNLYDSGGALVGNTIANASNLSGGGRWKFEAPVLEDAAVRYSISGVKVY